VKARADSTKPRAGRRSSREAARISMSAYSGKENCPDAGLDEILFGMEIF
jgi:hypothetical protein